MERKTIAYWIIIIFMIIVIQSCKNSRSDKFVGEWKRIDKPDSNNVVIKRENSAILLMSGKDTVQNTILLLGKSSPTPLQNNYKIKIHSNFDIDDIANHYVVDIVVAMKDELKMLKPTYGNYIMNLESSKDGNETHWLGLNIDENRYCAYFDSIWLFTT